MYICYEEVRKMPETIKMIRQQTYIYPYQKIRLQQESAKRKIDMAELIRAGLDLVFEKLEKEDAWDKDSLNLAVGAIAMDVDDAAENPDKYLYGKE